MSEIPDVVFFSPPRRTGLLIGTVSIAALAALDALFLAVVRRGPVTFLSFALGLLVVLTLFVIGFIGWRTYGVASGLYRLDRNALAIEWGAQRETVPLDRIDRLELGRDLEHDLQPRGVWWPGCVVGQTQSADYGRVRFYASVDRRGQVYLVSKWETIVLSPADVDGFQQAFEGRERLGVVEPQAPRVERPAFLEWAVWRDRWARGLVGANAAALVGLFGLVAAWATVLPARIPLHYNTAGQPDRWGAPLGLFILPLIGLVAFLVNVPLGAAFHFREDDRAAAYLLWGGALTVQAFVWAAAFGLIARIG